MKKYYNSQKRCCIRIILKYYNFLLKLKYNKKKPKLNMLNEIILIFNI